MFNSLSTQPPDEKKHRRSGKLLINNLYIKHSTIKNFRKTLRYFIFIIISLVMVLPIIWMFISSLRPADAIFRYTSELSLETFIPKELTLENYTYLFTQSNFPRTVLNTLFVGIVTGIIGVVINSGAGFAFATFKFKGKNLLYVIVLITFMMPFESIVIPLYVLIRGLGMFDTYQALIFPAIANGLVIFMYRQFLGAIPRELYEAAQLDGASWFQVYWKIAMQLCWPITVSGFLLLFIHSWESFFWPLVAASSPEHTLIQIEITRNMTADEAVWGRLFATSAFATLIPMLLFLFLQKYYVRSIISSAFK